MHVCRRQGSQACLAGHRLHVDEAAVAVVDDQHVGMAEMEGWTTRPLRSAKILPVSVAKSAKRRWRLSLMGS
jgi:hypothetical protein